MSFTIFSVIIYLFWQFATFYSISCVFADSIISPNTCLSLIGYFADCHDIWLIEPPSFSPCQLQVKLDGTLWS